MLANELRQVRMQPQTVALHQQKNPHQLARLIAKNGSGHVTNLAILDVKAIDNLVLIHPHPAPQRLLPSGPRQQREPLLDGAHG